jgi:hypothetical protein
MSVINLCEATGKGTLQSPEGALKDALEDIGNCGAFKNGKKLVIICLDDTDGNYDTTWIQAGMKFSEIVALLEIAKRKFITEMGY